MTEQTHPFVPGARVAIVSDRNNDRITESFVDKLHKSGRFTLLGSAQQWKALQCSNKWNAFETGTNGWTRLRLHIWDETTDAELTEKLTKTKRKQRLAVIQRRLNGVEIPTDAMLDAIEAVLP